MWITILKTIVVIIIVYKVLAIFVSRLVVPHMKFWRDPLPDILPAGMAEKIAELKAQARTPREFLEICFKYIGDRYNNGRLQTITRIHYTFLPLDKVWEMSGLMPCTQSNFLMRIFLVKSGFFTESDIKRKHIYFNSIIHQYLAVKVDGKWIDVDAGEKQRGLPLGSKRFLFSK